MTRLSTPYFEPKIVEQHRKDGYWIEAIDVDADGATDLVGYGLGEGEVTWYKNPTWAPTLITKLAGPVGMHHADIDGDGFDDIVICYQYGKTMVECDPDGGKIIWLENPGKKACGWKAHYIGRAPAMHRLKVGHFTQTRKLQVLALPIEGKPNAVHSTTPLLLFTQPDDVHAAEAWDGTVVDSSFYHVVHGVSVKKFRARQGSLLDSVLLASEEGISFLYYDEQNRTWQHDLIHGGEQTQLARTGFRGSGDVDVGRVGDDEFAYIPTVEPFHGNTVCVYCKDAAGSLGPVRWNRHVLDVYGDPNELGEGPGHFVVCADFDGDGDDEFLVALRGPMPWQGVFYYKALDVRGGVFAKWRVATESAARITVADFDNDGRLDFATMGYSVKGYYATENPQVIVYHNRFADLKTR